MITSTIKYTGRIESSLAPISVIKSSVGNTNRIVSVVTPISVIKSSVGNTNRIYSGLVQTTKSKIAHILLLTDGSDFLLSDGSTLNV